MFLDDDEALPTWCGTGLEDYVGTAWGMGPHQTPYQGVPLHVTDPAAPRPMPDLVSFYRWHLPDPVVFERTLRVTIQQIGAAMIPPGGPDLRAAMTQRCRRRQRLDAAGRRTRRMARPVRTCRRLLRHRLRHVPGGATRATCRR